MKIIKIVSLILLLVPLSLQSQTVNGVFETEIQDSLYIVDIAINLESDTGSAGVIQIEFTFNNASLLFPANPIKNTDYYLMGDFDQYVTQNITRPNPNSVRISLITLGTPPPVPLDTTLTTIVTFYFNIVNPQSTSNLIWQQTDVAPEFLQPNYTIGEWFNLDEPLSSITGLNELMQLPVGYALYQNYPNPFNPTTNIKFSLPEDQRVSIRIYDIVGALIDEIINKEIKAGLHTIEFDANKYPSGIYLYNLVTDKFRSVKKMLLIK